VLVGTSRMVAVVDPAPRHDVVLSSDALPDHTLSVTPTGAVLSIMQHQQYLVTQAIHVPKSLTVYQQPILCSFPRHW